MLQHRLLGRTTGTTLMRGLATVLTLGAFLWLLWGQAPTPARPDMGQEPEQPNRRVGRPTVAVSQASPPPASSPSVEQDSPERLQYREDLGTIAEDVGLAVVECAFRDPQTGGEVGRFLAFVDGVDNPDSGDQRRQGTVTVRDDFDREWQVLWSLSDEANHATCTASLGIQTFTFVVHAGRTGATEVSCRGPLSIGVNERPIDSTPCVLIAEGVEPVEVPAMSNGETYTITLEPSDPDDQVEHDELDLETFVDRVLEVEDATYAASEKWRGILDGLQTLRDQTPAGRIRDLLERDIEDYARSIEDWDAEEHAVSEKVDDVLDSIDEIVEAGYGPPGVPGD